jgi:acetyl-CoA carboxylase carboxyl transferase subunit alpha
MCSNFVELHGDRNFKDDKAMVGGFADLDGQTVMIIGQQKGINTKMRQIRNFGMANPEGYRKALRLMKLAEKFSMPIITLIDTPGASPGLEAEERGQGEAIARNLLEMSVLKVPVICVVIGEGASGGALGIGVGRVFYDTATFELQYSTT